MCCLFGLIDYNNTFNAKEKNRLIKILSTECEARGTDATGIAFNTESGLHISKRPVPAHKMWYRIPESARVVMGHTRMTTQGSESSTLTITLSLDTLTSLILLLLTTAFCIMTMN